MAVKHMLKSKPTETHARSIVKAVVYRLLIIISVFIITFATTKRLADAASITGITAITGTIIYYFYERIWSRITWGRK
jgi:uncharacterized membrane protein